jgi:hypothetical protein
MLLALLLLMTSFGQSEDRPTNENKSFAVTMAPTNLGPGGNLSCSVYSGTTSHIYWLQVRTHPTKFNVCEHGPRQAKIKPPEMHKNDEVIDVIRPEGGWGASYSVPPKDLPAVQILCESTLTNKYVPSRVYFGEEVAGSGLACTYDAARQHVIDCAPVE